MLQYTFHIREEEKHQPSPKYIPVPSSSPLLEARVTSDLHVILLWLLKKIIIKVTDMYPIVICPELLDEDVDESSFRMKATAALAFLLLHIVS